MYIYIYIRNYIFYIYLNLYILFQLSTLQGIEKSKNLK